MTQIFSVHFWTHSTTWLEADFPLTWFEARPVFVIQGDPYQGRVGEEDEGMRDTAYRSLAECAYAACF